LNPFEINLIRFENRIGRTVLPTPPVSAASTASPRRTQLLTIGPPSRPGPPVSRVDRVAPTPPSSTVARQRAARARRGRAAAASMTRRRTAPRRAQGPLSLSSALPPHGVHPPCPPPRRFPLKRSRRVPTEDFSHPARLLSRPSTPEHRTFVPIDQASSSPVFRHQSPSSAPDSIRASPSSAPLP
jgi:hypothetical protein